MYKNNKLVNDEYILECLLKNGNSCGLPAFTFADFEYEILLEDIVLPNTIKYIDAFAFYNCSRLKTIEFPEKVYGIGGAAFGKTGITELILPDSVTELKPFAFANCTKLSKLVLSKNIKVVPSYMFTNYYHFTVNFERTSNELYYDYYNIKSLTSTSAPEPEDKHLLQTNRIDIIIPEGIEEIGYKSVYLTNNPNVDESCDVYISLPLSLKIIDM